MNGVAMVNPVKGSSFPDFSQSPKKKPVKEIDVRVKKVVKKSKLQPPQKKDNSDIHAMKKIAARDAYLSAEKAAAAARLRAFETKQAALRAQKAAFLAQRAHMAQQAAAIRRARAAVKAKKAAERAAKKASGFKKVKKIKAYLARPEEKKCSKRLKKYFPSTIKKKDSK